MVVHCTETKTTSNCRGIKMWSASAVLIGGIPQKLSINFFETRSLKEDKRIEAISSNEPSGDQHA